MNYQYKIIVSGHNVYKEFEIPADLEHVKLGTTTACEFRLDPDAFFESIEVEIEKGNTWSLSCRDNLYLSKGDLRKLLSVDLLHGDVYAVCYSQSGQKAFELRFLIDFEAKNPDYGWYVDLEKREQTVIGDKREFDICLNSSFSKGSQIVLEKRDETVYLNEVSSQYGVYVNGKKVEEGYALKDHDFFSIADFSFYYKKKKLYFDIKNISVSQMEVYKLTEIDKTNYPLFIRNTRIKSFIDEEKIKILDPKEKPTKPEVNIVTSLMRTLVMFVLVVVFRGILNTRGGTYVIFSICSMGMGVITSVASLITGQRKYKKECKPFDWSILKWRTSPHIWL